MLWDKAGAWRHHHYSCWHVCKCREELKVFLCVGWNLLFQLGIDKCGQSASPEVEIRLLNFTGSDDLTYLVSSWKENGLFFEKNPPSSVFLCYRKKLVWFRLLGPIKAWVKDEHPSFHQTRIKTFKTFPQSQNQEDKTWGTITQCLNFNPVDLKVLF